MTQTESIETTQNTVIPSDTTLIPTDTNDLPIDTSIDTNDLPIDTNELPIDTSIVTNDLPIDTSIVTNDLPIVTSIVTNDTSIVTNDLPIDTSDTSIDTNDLPIDTSIDTNIDVTEIDNLVNSIELSRTQNNGLLGTPKQFGNLRLYGNDIEAFEGIAQKLGIKPYTLLHKVIEEFIQNQTTTSPIIHEDLIRKDEAAKCAERTQRLMQTFMPIATHDKEISDLLNLHESSLTFKSQALDSALTELSLLKATEQYKMFATTEPELIEYCLSFLRELRLQESAINPMSFINHYNNLREKYKNLRQELEEKHEVSSRALIKKMKDGFIDTLVELVDNHVQYPFISGDGMFATAQQKIKNL